MNLATEPWIPVLRRNGEHQLVSVCQVFQEGNDNVDLAARPHERIALMRLLICIAQAALDGPLDMDEWDHAPLRLPSAAERYLIDWRDAFDLFHPQQPFLQIAALENTGDATPVSKLDFALATGNASTIFDHGAHQPGLRTFSPQRMALLLITYLNFSPGGLIAQVKWSDQQTSKSSGDAPCVCSSMYHSFVRGGNLGATIHLNLLTKTTVQEFYGNNRWGRPVWEAVPRSYYDSDAVANATETYLGRLAPLPRLVLLSRDRETMLLGDGFRYPVFPTLEREPSATVKQVSNKRVLLGAGRRDIWRELPALVVKRHGEGLGGALTLKNIPDDQCFDLYVGALHRKAGQAEVLDAVESVLHISVGLQTDIGRATYEKEVLFAENSGYRLGRAVETYRENIDGGWTGRIRSAGRDKGALRHKLHSKATNHFWTSVEKLCPLLMAHVEAFGSEAIQVEQSRSAWRKAVHGAARAAYQVACGRDTPRQMRAFALGWSRLFAQPSVGEDTVELEEETQDE
jgi:CRISPR system Cascade subunit CasA